MFLPIPSALILRFPVLARHPKTCSFIHSSWGPAPEGAWSCCRKQRSALPPQTGKTCLLYSYQCRFGCWCKEKSLTTQSCVINGSIKPHTTKISYPRTEAVWRHHENACCINAAALVAAQPQRAGTAHKPDPPHCCGFGWWHLKYFRHFRQASAD